MAEAYPHIHVFNGHYGVLVQLAKRLQKPFQEAFPQSTDVNEDEIQWIDEHIDQYGLPLTVEVIQIVRAGWKPMYGLQNARFGTQERRGTTKTTKRCLDNYVVNLRSPAMAVIAAARKRPRWKGGAL